MDYRLLGQTKLEVGSIGLGCVTFGREIDQDASFEILDHAIEHGINLLDTAAVYAAGGSEKVLGNWMSSRDARDEVVLATKVTGTLTKEQIICSVEGSLQRLGTDRIDLLQLHGWDNETPIEETLESLSVLVSQGKVRYVGCSNWSEDQLGRGLLLSHGNSEMARLDSVQPPYNLVQRGIEPDTLQLCRDQQVGVISYSPLAAGFLAGKYIRGDEVSAGTRFELIPGHQSIYFTNEGFDVLENLRQIAKSADQSMIALALAWVFSRSGVTSVLIGARTTAHIDQAFAAEALSRQDSISEWLEVL